MKEIIIILLVLAFGFNFSVPATEKSPYERYINTIKGGIQTSNIDEPAKTPASGVESVVKKYLQCTAKRQVVDTIP